MRRSNILKNAGMSESERDEIDEKTQVTLKNCVSEIEATKEALGIFILNSDFDFSSEIEKSIFI